MQTEDIEGSNSIGFRWEVSTLGSFEEGFFNDIPEEDRYVAFADPSTYAEGPGWPLRNLLVLIRQRFRASRAKILCYRGHLGPKTRSQECRAPHRNGPRGNDGDGRKCPRSQGGRGRETENFKPSKPTSQITWTRRDWPIHPST
ncbi:Autophagy protein 7 [Metarhizium acridum]|nr:Autophagy protein 7 [Metarhizium acridum]